MPRVWIKYFLWSYLLLQKYILVLIRTTFGSQLMWKKITNKIVISHKQIKCVSILLLFGLVVFNYYIYKVPSSANYFISFIILELVLLEIPNLYNDLRCMLHNSTKNSWVSFSSRAWKKHYEKVRFSKVQILGHPHMFVILIIGLLHLLSMSSSCWLSCTTTRKHVPPRSSKDQG